MDERTQLKNAIDRYLKTLEPWIMFEKRSPGFGTRTGIADYTGCYLGRFFAIEIKHPVSRPPLKKDQKKYLDRVAVARGSTCVAYSVTDVQTFISLIAERVRKETNGAR